MSGCVCVLDENTFLLCRRFFWLIIYTFVTHNRMHIMKFKMDLKEIGWDGLD
jgi:hypothetical protein